MKNLKRFCSCLFVCAMFLTSISFYFHDSNSIQETINKNISINSSSIVTINDFSNFSLMNDNSHISSTNLDENITFSFTGASTNWMDDYETYKLDFGYDNCTDFDITMDLEYNTYSSYWGDFTLRLGTHYPKSYEYNEEVFVLLE